MKYFLLFLLFLICTPVLADTPQDDFLGIEGVVSADQSIDADGVAVDTVDSYIMNFQMTGADLENGDKPAFPAVAATRVDGFGSSGGRPASWRSYLIPEI